MLIGTNIKAQQDMLKDITVKELYNAISNPDKDLQSKVANLRIVKQIDDREYRKSKTVLPYVVCGNFTPSVRRGENFSSIDCFILDIDNVSSSGIDLCELRSRIEQDERIALSFISPGEDGLKLLFRLSEKCYDRTVFSSFYKSFTTSFSSQYGLESVVDFKTCDVTRACFLSVDNQAFFRENPRLVDYKEYVDADSPQYAQDIVLDEIPFDDETVSTSEIIGPSESDMDRIRQILFKKRQAAKEESAVFVPEILNEIIGSLVLCLSDNNVTVDNVRDIQYGKKLQMTCDGRFAEVNLFYGRNGFTVVESPKRGTNAELNGMLAEFIEYYLRENCKDA